MTETVPEILPVRMLALDSLEEAAWNVTEDDEKSLALLIANIKQVGFAENLVVMPLEGDRLRIVSGHDKARAARALRLTKVPCAVLPAEFPEEIQKLLTVRMNVIKKKLSPLKLMRLMNELSSKYSEDIARSMMMFSDQAQLDHMLKTVRQAMPTAAKKELDKKKESIKSTDDLASVVGEIYNRAGTQLSRGFAIFSFGGQHHIYSTMEKPLRAKIMSIVDKSDLENRHVSEILKEELGIHASEKEEVPKS